MLNASASTSFINEQCHTLLQHIRILRFHLKVTGAKTFFVQRVLELFDAFEVTSIKLMTQPKLERLEKRVLKKIDQNRRALASAIINFVSGPAPSVSKATAKVIEKSIARDLNFVMKHLNKKIIQNLKNQIAREIINQVNKEINETQKIIFVFES